MSNVIIFGLNDFAELANYYLESDSQHEVKAFAVTREFMPEENTFEGKPVVSFEEIENDYPPSMFKFFVPMSYSNMNTDREKIYLEVKAKGYECISYISSRATVFNGEVGENCFILENNTVQPFTQIGDNVVLWSGNHIGHHSVINSHVFISSHVVVSGHCNIGRYSFIGVNSSVKDYVSLGEGSLVGMGSVITENTSEWSLYFGNPAKRIREVVI